MTESHRRTTEGHRSLTEPALYLCRDCGNEVEDSADTIECPACGAPLTNTTSPD